MDESQLAICLLQKMRAQEDTVRTLQRSVALSWAACTWNGMGRRGIGYKKWLETMTRKHDSYRRAQIQFPDVQTAVILRYISFARDWLISIQTTRIERLYDNRSVHPNQSAWENQDTYPPWSLTSSEATVFIAFTSYSNTYSCLGLLWLKIARNVRVRSYRGARWSEGTAQSSSVCKKIHSRWKQRSHLSIIGRAIAGLGVVKTLIFSLALSACQQNQRVNEATQVLDVQRTDWPRESLRGGFILSFMARFPGDR